jgi:tripeptidyl-peptidase-1
MKLGLMGHTVIFASGDSGVAGPDGDQNNSNGCMGVNGTVFNPGWPNTCPYITNVGATKIMPGKSVTDPEVAVTDPAGQPYSVPFSSGGGFSNIYPTPKYQLGALNTYFANSLPSYKFYLLPYQSIGSGGGRYNRLGRGYPDVAAVGDNILVYNRGHLMRAGGTSASAPIFGAIINRINDERLAVGKRPVGFINPTLYAHPEILNDIVSGTNPGCGTKGFKAVKGWDPVSGLGTPNYAKMLALWMNLP